jgi:tRNA (Thr-GGU) A37 N-methylase
MGVFSICSPYRPNPIGLSVLEVVAVEKNILTVKNADMLDGTPIFDIKPHITGTSDCPSCPEDAGN